MNKSVETFYSVSNADLERLSPEGAVDRLRDLLWAEAARIGVGKNLINVPSAIYKKDGGVDAEVKDVVLRGGSGIIKDGNTRYQIKTGEFRLRRNADLENLLFSKAKGVIKPRIKACLDAGGTFVVVLFGSDDPETSDDALANRCRERLGEVDEKYKAARIEVWRQNTLRSFFEDFPSLALRLNGNDQGRFQSHESWAQNSDMRVKLKIGEEHQEVVRSVRESLREDNQAVHVRVWGEPGIGKTRLALEATGGEDLAPLVVYCDSPKKVDDSDLMNRLVREDNHQAVLLVIDECDPDSRARIWNRLSAKGPRIKLLTIYNEHDAAGQLPYVEIPPLSDNEIKQIIVEYGVPEDHAGRWGELCSGSPRVAHVIGENLRNNPEDVLRSASTSNVWDRYIVGGDQRDSHEVEQRRLVLRYIALFKRFGFTPPLVGEARAIGVLVNAADSSITWPRFQEIIQGLRRRKILQGETTLYITPKALHIYLWVDWWNTYGDGLDALEFVKGLSPQLKKWFLEMFRYAASSGAAQRKVDKLLGLEGAFRDDTLLRTELGSDFFLALSEASPRKALRCLERTIGKWNHEQIKEFRAGRRQVIWALERIAVWRDTFQGAARILLLLAVGENETYANNSTGVFTGLFAPAPGRVAPTEAPPSERLPILVEALKSGSGNTRRIALDACKTALSTGPFHRMVGAEYQGLRKEPQLWTPRNYGEMFDAYRSVWMLVGESIDQLGGKEQEAAVLVLLESARSLLRIENLRDMVLDTIDDLARHKAVDRMIVLKHLLLILRFERKELPDEVRKRLESLESKLTGSDYASLLRRYVGTDFDEDVADDTGKFVDPKEGQIEELAKEAVRNPALLDENLDWLTTEAAKDGFRFGYFLATHDKEFQLLSELVRYQRKTGDAGTLYFFGGYLRVLAERATEQWEELLDTFASDDSTAAWVVELTWRSAKLTDRASERILSLVERQKIGIAVLGTFVYGGVIRQLSTDHLSRWVEVLLESDEPGGAPIALDLCQMFTLREERELPVSLIMKLLLHRSWYEPMDRDLLRRDFPDYGWSELARKAIAETPENGLKLAKRIIANFGKEGTILEHSDRISSLLSDIAKTYPTEVWEMVSEYLGPPADARAFHLGQWLRSKDLLREDESGSLIDLPREEIWRWVDKDVEKRAWYLATMVPKDLGKPESLARELLVRYGDREDVRRNLLANYGTEGWSGPASSHFEGQKTLFEELKEKETNPRVNQWLGEQISHLEWSIERARIEEEREE